MHKIIILGIGIVIILLSLAGTVSSKNAYIGADCGVCHAGIVDGNYSLTTDGSYFREVHKFNSEKVPSNKSSCLTCHTDLIQFLPLTSVGSSYNQTHRYNATILAAKMLTSPGCGNCHVNAAGNNFSFLSGTPTYLTSTTCQACHKAKYDKWSNTLHRVMLTGKSKAQAMGISEPEVGWADISYVIVTKFQFAYINTTGYFLDKNDVYDTENKTFADSSHAGGAYGTCGRCHTTGWNSGGWSAGLLNGLLPGINGTFIEPGIACERCHKPAGNGHQVEVNYSGNQCRECHTGSNHGTDWENSKHAPPPYEAGSNCVFCHSPFDKYKNENVTKENATGVSCGVCHNIHDITDGKYAETFTGGIFNKTTWAEVSNAKLGFFNATASTASGTAIFDVLVSPALLYPGMDSSRKDTSYGTAPINVTGLVTEVLCSKCHYRHGLAHITGVNLTHSRLTYPQSEWATCVDCHMAGINASVGKDMMKRHSVDPFKDVNQSCGSTTQCHTTSAQKLNKSLDSIVPIINEWKQSLHNDKVNGGFYENGTSDRERASSCSKCHSPVNWNPVNPDVLVGADAFKGITCEVCHNIHDMGDWLLKTKAKFGEAKAYAWYDRDAEVAATNATTGLPKRYKASYAMMANTTELCGNCHANIREGRSGPGWASATAANPISPHGFPAKDLFIGSFKESYMKFECIDCHMYSKKTDATGAILNDNEKITGHRFAVNATGLSNKDTCNTGCHDGTTFASIPDITEDIQTKTHNKWNTTNATVMSVLNNVKQYAGEKNESRTLIAVAYWNLRLVSSDNSWGVHNQIKVNQLLDDAVTIANAANVALGSNTLASAITPNSRNAQLGTPVTLFMSVINSGTATAPGVGISQASGLPATVSYQQWDGTSLIRSADTPLDIAAGATANFVLAINVTSAFDTSSMTFNVSGNKVAAPISAVNTLTISANETPSADVIMMSTTLNVSTPVNNATAFALATTNVGGAGATDVSLVVSVPSTITGLAYQVNQTNPATGAIIGPANGLFIGVGAQPAFAVFMTPTQPIAYDPTNNRIMFTLIDGKGKVIGAQSVAVSAL